MLLQHVETKILMLRGQKVLLPAPLVKFDALPRNPGC